MQASLEQLEREKKELQGLVERKAFLEEELEREVERLRHMEQRASVISNPISRSYCNAGKAIVRSRLQGQPS